MLHSHVSLIIYIFIYYIANVGLLKPHFNPLIVLDDISVIICIYFILCLVWSCIKLYQISEPDISIKYHIYELRYLVAKAMLVQKNRSPQVQGSCATEVEITFETWNSFMICRESVKPKWGSIWYIYIHIDLYYDIIIRFILWVILKKNEKTLKHTMWDVQQ